MTETIATHGTLSGYRIPQATVNTCLSAFIGDNDYTERGGYSRYYPWDVPGDSRGVEIEGGDYWWLERYGLRVWEACYAEGDEYGVTLSNEQWAQTLAPDEQILLIFLASQTRAHMERIAVRDLLACIEQHSGYVVIATKH